MIVSIFTPTPQFANDMADVVRVFFGNIDLRINESGGELALTHTESVAGDARQCCIEASGVCAAQAESVRPLYADALEEKRIHKRQLKQGVYAVMKQITGRTPPWGSLTGIRPTRLLYAGLSQGLTLDEAARQVQEQFDVQSEKLSLLREIVSVQTALPQPGSRDIDLYVGIPFCVSRCAYCSFLSGEVGKVRQLPPYVDAL